MTTTTILVTIPDADASRSKMAKKGWKCWAKVLRSVATPANDGYAYEGEFVSVGSAAECEIGDVILHVDQSSNSGIGVVMANKAGKGFIRWIATTSDTKWAGPLAGPARKLLAMPVEARIAHVAGVIADNPREDWSDAVRQYWNQMAGRETTGQASIATVTDERAEAIAKIKALIAQYSIIADEL